MFSEHKKARIGVLASGGGSNLQALIDACENNFIPGKIVIVISDKSEAYALERARRHDIKALSIDPKNFPSRESFDLKLVEILKGENLDLICLAGYMRILSSVFIKAFPDKIMNIHPALLPSFPGLHAQKQAFDYGVKVAGCTVHFVDEKVDHGPIIIQAAIPVFENDTAETLQKRILEKEHIIYPQAVKWFCEGRLRIVGRRVRIKGIKSAGIIDR